MKQDPISPSIHISAMKAPSKRMVPSLEKIGSFDYMIGESFVALVLHGLCVLIAFWCMEIPKRDNPLYSSIQVAFEAPVALPIPDDAPNIDQSDLQTSVTEPIVEASETLPQIDAIAPISIPRSQKIVSEKRQADTQPTQNETHKSPATHSASANQQLTPTQHSVAPSVQSASQILSPSQRCSVLTKDYPMAARRRHEQGTVQVSYQLLADGQVKQVGVLESSGFSDLDQAAIQAVQAMRCQAAPGQPVIKTTMPVHFSLNKLK
ncbi:energy transducer TonB [Commensalibacter papalotli (ex Servin-Garciduenas et al. 2014)]|uniref:TonB protein n=1 Tax=Commensalibacter papalotli (ex Servin-Garciduenas et al. 2014) TaxID=1208583 RepID=W7DT01_9PROT|nr:energy transducer TonB [Commensalibacter papalotli (ex Servin-Garciduenas et al. 2014)]EUK18055.1 TonB protein [Commensalibacter papalotli (ex Servin-Garciduenas et al. 2014)]